GHRQQRRPGAVRVPCGRVRPREHPLLPDAGRDVGPRGAMGQAGEQPGRIPLGRSARAVLVQVQLRLEAGRQVMNRRILGLLTAAALCAATTAWAQVPSKADVDAAMKAAYDKYKGLKEGANA